MESDQTRKSQYESIQILGRGAYGKVKKYKKIDTNEFVAIKKIKIDENIKDIEFEIEVLQKLNHKNIIQYRESYTVCDSYYVVTELLEKDLRSYIQCILGPMAFDLIQSYLYQLLLGTEYIHQSGFIHRDIKPQNLLIDKVGHLKICDFGSCVKYSQGNQYDLCTTYCYVSPEVCIDINNQTPALDMWSVGCVFGEMLTKRALFCCYDYKTNPLENQIALIYKTCGFPDDDEKKTFHFLDRDNFPKDGELLLNKFLEYVPESRISADDALKHQYFSMIDKSLYV